MTTDALNSLTSSARGAFSPLPRKTAPFSLRLSAEERAELEARAGTLALGAYIKGQLFEGQKTRRPAIRLSYDFSCRLEDIVTAAGSDRSRTAAREGSARRRRFYAPS